MNTERAANGGQDRKCALNNNLSGQNANFLFKFPVHK